MSLLQQDCEYDSVELRSGFDDNADGGDGSGKVHGTFCGSTLPQPITSDGNKLRITFSTDNTVQKTGFSAVFFTGILCGEKEKKQNLMHFTDFSSLTVVGIVWLV